jgi:hypothetical protein
VGDAHLVIRKPAELAAPDLNRLHGHEDGLLAFAAQELAPDTLHRGMQRVLDAADSTDSRDALPQRHSLKRGHEDGVAAVLTRRSGDVGVGTQRAIASAIGAGRCSGLHQVVVLVPFVSVDQNAENYQRASAHRERGGSSGSIERIDGDHSCWATRPTTARTGSCVAATPKRLAELLLSALVVRRPAWAETYAPTDAMSRDVEWAAAGLGGDPTLRPRPIARTDRAGNPHPTQQLRGTLISWPAQERGPG